MIDLEILMQAVMESRDGITISDPSGTDNPLIFVNPAFEKLTGYLLEDIIYKNCRYLQGKDRKQRDIGVIRDAIRKGESCLVTLRNYRKDGTMFWNELSISPVLDKTGALTHFIGIQKDVTARVLLEQRLLQERKFLEDSKALLENIVIHDTLTGIYNRRYFEDQFYKMWKHFVDTRSNLVVMMVNVDHFKQFNDSYGHLAADEVLKQVAITLKAAFGRSTDFVARFSGEEFIVLSTDMTEEQATSHAEALCLNIRNLKIHHPTPANDFLTISCGIACIKPTSGNEPEMLLNQADLALNKAKEMGRNRAVLVEA